MVAELARDQHVEDEEADRLHEHADEAEDAASSRPSQPAPVKWIAKYRIRPSDASPVAAIRPAPGLPSITSWPSLPGVSRSSDDEADHEDREPDAGVGEHLQDEFEHLRLPLSRR